MNERVALYTVSVAERMLEFSFPGREDVLTQLRSSKIGRLFTSEDGAVFRAFFEVRSSESATVRSWAPVTAIGIDSDGVPIDYILHVEPGGKLEQLEIAKRDGNAIIELPDVSTIEVNVRPV